MVQVAALFLLAANYDRDSSSPIQWAPNHFQAVLESAGTLDRNAGQLQLSWEEYSWAKSVYAYNEYLR